MAIGTYGLSETELLELIKAYPYDEVIIDTAYRYGNEEDVASAIMKSGYPKEYVRYIGKISYSQQISGKTVSEELKDTLRRLQINSIDFYLIHSPRYERCCETWEQLIQLKDKGYIYEIGVSNFSEENIRRLHETSGIYPAVNQIVHNPFNESDKTEQLIEYCLSNGISIQIAMPFGGREHNSDLSDEHRNSIITELCERGLLSIIGTHNRQHMIQNFQALEEFASVYKTKIKRCCS